jgi:hypothetical protein
MSGDPGMSNRIYRVMNAVNAPDLYRVSDVVLGITELGKLPR